jgi:hypothetical protein
VLIITRPALHSKPLAASALVDRATRSVKANRNVTNQRVVLLAGPHKTGSSSIQANLMHWLGDENHPSNLAVTWAWPAPAHQCIPQSEKAFYPWVKALVGEEINTKFKCHVEREELIQVYRREFHNQWTRGKSLVIATEAMARAAAHDDLIDTIIHQLPWSADYSPKVGGGDENITVVIVYRSPRVAHLQSMWHQCCMMENVTFYNYLVGPHFQRKKFSNFDSLFLAKRFLEKGLTVTLIDMEGVTEQGYDISNIVACDILGANCNANKMFGL